MANLASTYRDQGRWNEAEKLHVQVLEAKKRVLGPEHLSTLNSMIGLAFTWRSQGKLQDALTLMKQCSELHNKVFGPSHPLSRSSSHTVNEWMDEYNALKDQIPGKGPQTRPEVSEGSSAAVITTPSTYEGHVHLPYPQRRSAATLFLRNHPLMIAARTPLPSSPEGQNLQDVD